MGDGAAVTALVSAGAAVLHGWHVCVRRQPGADTRRDDRVPECSGALRHSGCGAFVHRCAAHSRHLPVAEQPALLYIVPAVCGCAVLQAALRGELGQFLGFKVASGFLPIALQEDVVA